MKILKYSFAILVVSMIANVAMASAATTLEPHRSGIWGTFDIAAGKTVTTVDVAKERISTQYFYNDYTNTPLTSPCKNCQIKATLQRKINSSWNIVASTTVKMDNKGYFSGNTSEAPGTYRLQIRRNDVTLLTTTVIWDWYIQDPIK